MSGLTKEDLEKIKLWVRRSRNFHRQTKSIFLFECYSALAGQVDILDEELTKILDKIKDAGE